MSPDLNRSSSAIEDRATHRIISTAITKLRDLERELDGDMRTDVIPARAQEIMARINDLHQALDWLQIDLDGQWRWPVSAGEAVTPHQRVA